MADRIQGRGASYNPGNRFEKLHLDELSDEMEKPHEERVQTTYFRDSSRTILAKNDSPDVPFTFSVNPYRGCEHGCIYCYARPTHEFLGFSAGLDFESKILIKTDAPQLLEEAFQNPSFEPQVIALSGNTDCYQPVERKLKITRGCLEVFLKYRNPVSIITKNALVLRDLDIFQEMRKYDLISITISITSLSPEIISKMEPRTSTPDRRLHAIRTLAEAGIPVGVKAAPLIPGLTDSELPEILKQAAAHGAKYANYIMVRLPYAVKELFVEWVQREFPDRAGKILNRIRDVRGGNLSDPRFHTRMTGEGEIAKNLSELFEITCRRLGLNEDDFEQSTAHFVRSGQISLFP